MDAEGNGLPDFGVNVVIVVAFLQCRYRIGRTAGSGCWQALHLKVWRFEFVRCVVRFAFDGM